MNEIGLIHNICFEDASSAVYERMMFILPGKIYLVFIIPFGGGVDNIHATDGVNQHFFLF